MNELYMGDEDCPVEKPLRGSNINEVIAAYNAGRPMITKSNSQQFAIDKFEPILAYAQELDFLTLAYADNPKKLKKIQALRIDIQDFGLSDDDRRDARNELRSLEPKDKHKLIVAIEELIRVMSILKIEVKIFPDGCTRYYSPEFKYWKLLEPVMRSTLFSEFAMRCGLPRLIAYDEKSVKTMELQFANVATVIPEDKDESQEHIIRINLNNGVYVISKDFRWLVPHDPNFNFKYVLKFDYDPEAKAPRFMQFLDEVQEEKEAPLVMSEAVALALTKLNLHKCLLLVGEGLNGKTVFVDVITGVLGRDNVCSYSLSSLASDRQDATYTRAVMNEYLINMVTEMDAKDCNPEIVKTLIARESVSARLPFGKPFTIRDYATMIFCCNALPRTSDISPGYFRRWMALYFLRTIPEDKIELDLAERIIATEKAGVFNWILEGVERLLQNKNFTFSPKIDKATKRFRIESDIVALFLEMNGYKKSDSHIVVSEMYADFVKFCDDNGISRKCTRILFYKRLETQGLEVKRHATNNDTWVYATNKHHQTAAEIENLVCKHIWTRKEVTTN